MTIAIGVAIAAVTCLLLDEPKGAMAEVLPDGTVQMIDIH
jgi:NNP family nitrate/nitrite transporter-like MFS transporter